MFIDIGVKKDEKPVRIAIYEDSDPQQLAYKFITQQKIDDSEYYQELVTMMRQAKEEALIQRQRM